MDMRGAVELVYCLKERLNASKPSKHPPDSTAQHSTAQHSTEQNRGGKCQNVY